jgi:3-deoxy-7-phosphoheptulonate synthase
MKLLEELPDLSILRPNWTGCSHYPDTHHVEVHGVAIGGDAPVIIAGPCAVESYEQTLAIATEAKAAGADLLRGGCYKPRTNPHSFQGLEQVGLEILAEVRGITGLGIVTEVMDPREVETVASYADMLQIGSRSMQNFPLLTEVGRSGVPVLLKRGWSATLEEWLCAAEYIAIEGNREIVLCERGVRTSCSWSYARNILDLNVIEPVREVTPLPIVVDPSHATGEAALVPALGLAALEARAHGLLIEVVASEQMRECLQCDAAQGILPGALRGIVEKAESIERRNVAEKARRQRV